MQRYPLLSLHFYRKIKEVEQTKRKQLENPTMGSQFGPYDWKIREAELRDKAKREKEKKDGDNQI